jgi:hypothetical protein
MSSPQDPAPGQLSPAPAPAKPAAELKKLVLYIDEPMMSHLVADSKEFANGNLGTLILRSLRSYTALCRRAGGAGYVNVSPPNESAKFPHLLIPEQVPMPILDGVFGIRLSSPPPSTPSPNAT